MLRRRKSKRERTQTLRQTLVERDGTQCHWCKVELEFAGKHSAARYATIDHVIRRKDGGLRVPENTVLACYKCNSTRHAPWWKPGRLDFPTDLQFDESPRP